MEHREAMGRAVMAVIATHEKGIRNSATVTADPICGHDESLNIGHVQAILDELSLSVDRLMRRRTGGSLTRTPCETGRFWSTRANTCSPSREP